MYVYLLKINDMKKLNLKEIILKESLNKRELAAFLFPQNQNQGQALRRIINLESDLSETQISKLALLVGVEVEDLYKNTWKGKSSKGVLKLICGSYVALLDTKTLTTRLFSNLTLLHEEVFVKDQITLSNYVEYLDKLILNHKNK